MSAQVDVDAVIVALVRGVAGTESDSTELRDGAFAARAAIAELIAADREYDEARAGLTVTTPEHLIDPALARWEAAKSRRASALAAVGQQS